jgi:hypothetical protein
MLSSFWHLSSFLLAFLTIGKSEAVCVGEVVKDEDDGGVMLQQKSQFLASKNLGPTSCPQTLDWVRHVSTVVFSGIRDVYGGE